MSTAARGREFEIEVADFFRAAGFDVTPNARSAIPRQTDLFAKSDGIYVLVEVKNRKRSVGVDDIDSLRSRLNRTPPDIVGAIFSTSGLTKGAIEAIEGDRRREVLVFVKEEVEQLRARSQNLKTLIERKRDELRVSGHVWLSATVRQEFIGLRLPLGSVEFLVSGETKSLFESRSSFGGAFYALEVPDTGWGSISGEGVRLSIRPALHGARDLRDLVGYLHKKFGLSSNGMFRIAQSGSCWHGVGAENFLRTAEQWRSRYAQSLSKKFHHSEELRYFDQFRDGWIELSCQQRIYLESGNSSRPAMLHGSELVIQLPGVPVDALPFVNLCQYTQNEWASFKYVGQRSTCRVRLKAPVALKATGTVVNRDFFDDASDQGRTVIAVLAQNPFFRKKSLPTEFLKSDLPRLRELHETELLLCALRDWYDDGDSVDGYVLEGIDVTAGGAGDIIRPFGTWSRIVRRAVPAPIG